MKDGDAKKNENIMMRCNDPRFSIAKRQASTPPSQLGPLEASCDDSYK